ncbi:LytTR family transcriptional regulator DNA-binding domain-containing protein [Marinobacter hydrocarbonoclasticus]|nr:LytTR family transcriptional regulator DNA-binding domain-containing protein [Marinobacter nauticus]
MTILAHNLADAPSFWQWPRSAYRPAPITIWLVGASTDLFGTELQWPVVSIPDLPTLRERVMNSDMNEVLIILAQPQDKGFIAQLDDWVAKKRLVANQWITLPHPPQAGESSLLWTLITQAIERRFELEMSALEAQLIRSHQPAEQARLCAEFVSRWLHVARIEFDLPGQPGNPKKAPPDAMVFCWQTVPHCALSVYLASEQPQAAWIQSRFEALKQTQVACRQSFPNIQQAGYLGRLHEQSHRILYLVGANQYCEVVWADTARTELFSMPLKMVHRYMHKELVQVHRSYLVNPDRVQGARRKRNGRVELFLHLTRIPVGDTYKQALEDSHFHWFERAESSIKKAP